MRYLKIIGLVLLSGTGSVSCAQCGFDEVLQERMADAAYRARMEQNEQRMQEWLVQRDGGDFPPIGIPVVVHVVHTGGAIGTPYNPSDASIQEVLACVNERFAGQLGVGVNTGISFCLAQVDPQGNPTNGIDRVDGTTFPGYVTYGLAYSTLSAECDGPTDIDLAFPHYWPVQHYYNIYLVWNICQPGIAGFAYLPDSTDPWDDGAYIEMASWGCDDISAAHELGHGMGLYHTFQGDNGGTTCPVNTNCTTNGDKVCDTPPHKKNDCSASANPCDPDLALWPNSRKNFMSYCNSSRDRFTADQRDRMRAQIAAIREHLAIEPCQQNMPPTAALQQSSTYSCSGQVQFHDASGNFPTQWHWFFGDGGEDTTADPYHQYTSAGVYQPLLIVVNAQGGDTVAGEPITVDLACACPGPVCAAETWVDAQPGYGIASVRINGTLTTSGDGASEGYQDHACALDTVEAGSLLQLRVITTAQPQNAAGWIDWDASGTFSPQEQVLNTTGLDTAVASVLVPIDAVLLTPLRIRFWTDLQSYPAPNACAGPYYGQVEDYGLVVVPALSTHIAAHAAPPLQLVPNPTSGEVWLMPTPALTGSAQVQVFNAVGQAIGQPLHVLEGKPQLLDLSGAANGVYTVRCTWKNEVRSLRLVVAR